MAKKKLSAEDAQAITPGEIHAVLQGGVQFIGEAEPIIKVLFEKISGWVNSLGGPNSPKGRLKRIEALEAKDLLQKELNKTVDARLLALEGK